MTTRDPTFGWLGREVAEAYDLKAADYAHLYEGRSRLAHFYRMRMKRVWELVDALPPGRILEVGCGPGLMAPHFLQHDFEYVGVDISPGMIAEAKRTCGEDDSSADFTVGDVQQLPFPDASFDVVLCLGALEYVSSERLALHEMRRVLRPSGLAVISANNKWSPYNVWDRLVYRRAVSGTQPDAIVREFHSEVELNRLLAVEGLEVVESIYFDFSLVPRPLGRGRVLSRVDALIRGWLARLSLPRPLQKLGNGLLVTCAPTRAADLPAAD